jgi:hypothetical protein
MFNIALIKPTFPAAAYRNAFYKFYYVQAILILTIKGNKAYIISYNAEPTKFSYYLPTLQKMIDS